jgi:hypothetical protein
MTAQTTEAVPAAEAVDEAFWELVLSEPDLLDAAFYGFADPEEPTGPSDGPPAGEPDGADHPTPPGRGTPAPAPLPVLADVARSVSGRVRDPPDIGERRPARAASEGE